MSDAANPMTASEREALIAYASGWADDLEPRRVEGEPMPSYEFLRAAAAELSRLGKIEERAKEAMERNVDYDAAYFVAERILKGDADDA